MLSGSSPDPSLMFRLADHLLLTLIGRFEPPRRPRSEQTLKEAAVYGTYAFAHLISRRAFGCQNAWDGVLELMLMFIDPWDADDLEAIEVQRAAVEFIADSHVQGPADGPTPWALLPHDGDMDLTYWHGDCWTCAWLVGRTAQIRSHEVIMRAM